MAGKKRIEDWSQITIAIKGTKLLRCAPKNNSVQISEAARDLLIEYINQQTANGGYYKAAGERRLELIRSEIYSSVTSFLQDTKHRKIKHIERFYNNRGLADDITITFTRSHID